MTSMTLQRSPTQSVLDPNLIFLLENIDTDLRITRTAAIRKVFAENPGEFGPRKYLAPSVDALVRPLQ
jgi:hypothetical protein